ncbi:MAG: hypothetical protein GDA44_11455 [Prochloron sp. SP5CPC1]|nr:hypothetical protein [Candidatus Paraprochloron terpiosi SP5CPC1]
MEPVGVWEWFWLMLLFAIPIVNHIGTIVWGYFRQFRMMFTFKLKLRGRGSPQFLKVTVSSC